MKPLVVGVTGLAAGMGLQCYMLRRLPELYRMKWLCDLDEARVKRAAADYGGRGTGDIDDVLRDPEVDLVTIATPVTTHATLAKRALAAGKHVLLEKPITATVAEADELVGLAKASRGVLCVGHQRRFMANQRAVEDVVRGGVLGALLVVRLDLPVCQAKGTDEPADPATWERRFVAGPMYDYGVHHVDQICRLLQEKPQRVYGRTVTRPGQDLPVAMQIELTMPSGVLASVSMWPSHAPDPKWQLDGEAGSLRMAFANDMGACQLYQRQPDGATRVREIQRPHLKDTVDAETGLWRPKTGPEIHGYTDLDAHMAFYRHLFVAMTQGGPVPVPAEDARDAIKVLWLAVESARQGAVMKWS